MPERRDANRIALRAARSILDAATDLTLDVEGTAAEVRVERLPSMPWPHLQRDGQEPLDEAAEGPWPGAVQARCTWKGGSRTLFVEADYWAKGSSYAYLIALRVSPAESRQQLIWMSLAGPLRDAGDGTECTIPASISIRRGGVAEGAPSALKAAVVKSGLPMMTSARVEAFRVRLPGGEVSPSPAEAFRRLVHLALLKLPYLVRPESGTWGSEVPWFSPLPPGPASEDTARDTGRRVRLSPLPGGVRQYKATLEELLEWLAAAPRSVQDFEAMLQLRYAAHGAGPRQSYRRLLMNLGLVEETGGTLDLTGRGQAYRTSRDALLLFDWLHEAYQGLLAVLVMSEAPGGAGTRETHRLLVSLLGAEWQSHRQTNVRQNWLLSLGLTERSASGDVLTNRGHEALSRHAAEAAALRGEIAEMRDEAAALGSPPELDEDDLDEDGEALPPDPTAPATQLPGDAGEPAGWGADRLDLTAAQVRPHLGPLELPAGVLDRVCAALSAGKHLLLIGPPGTGKTELAHALALAARTEGYCRGLFEATASADWTTYETIGGYALERDKSLRFRPGAFLRAVESWQWLLVDELNRADVDKAFGELMTVLGGRGSDTPFELEGGRRVSIGFDAGRTHRVSRTFRVIATMNTWDKTSLFRLSYAVQRRFAVVDLGIPSDEAYARLLSQAALGPGLDPALDEPTVRRLAQLFQRRGLLAWRDIGPAIALDMVRYMRRRTASGDGLAEAVGMFLLPQLEGLDPESARAVYGLFLSALTGWTSEAALRELRGRCADVWPPGSLPEA